MNEFLSNRYTEIIHRLALGLEPLDVLRGGLLSFPLQIAYDAVPAERPAARIERHPSGRYALRYRLNTKRETLAPLSPVVLRCWDGVPSFATTEQPDPLRRYRPETDRRRIVPRRLQIPLRTWQEVEAITPPNPAPRVRALTFFPGAAYPLGARATALRGSLWRGGKPLRWARIEACVPTIPQDRVVARAHGDERGEFLLSLSDLPTSSAALPPKVALTIKIYGVNVPAPDLPAQLQLDPLWDLPRETLAPPGSATDPVAAGADLPAGYSELFSQANVTFVLGECVQQAFTF